MAGAPGFDTYTNNGIRFGTITTSSFAATALQRADIGENLGKAIGSSVGEIAGDGIRFKVATSSVGDACSLYTCVLSTVADKDVAYYIGIGADKEAITVSISTTAGGSKRAQVHYWKTDGTNIVDTVTVDFVTTDLWFEVLRNAAKTQTTVNIYDADTFDVGDLIPGGSITTPATPTTEFTEHYGGAGEGSAGANTITSAVSEYVVPWAVDAEFVTIVDAQDLRMITGGTISAWFAADTTGGGAEGRIIDKDAGGADGYALMVTGTNQIQLSVGAVDSITGNNVYTNSTLTHVLAEFTSAGRRMWVNNVEVSLTNPTDTTLPADTAGEVFLGNQDDGSNGFNGQLDEISLHNRKLEESEREKIYNAGLGKAIL